jgi:VanZ family protein
VEAPLTGNLLVLRNELYIYGNANPRKIKIWHRSLICRNDPLERISRLWHKPQFLYYWLPPFLWCLVIIGMSGNIASFKNTRYWLYRLLSCFTTVDLGGLTQVNVILRKMGHTLAYGIQYFLWFRAFRAHMVTSKGRSCLYALGLCLFLAITDEGRQSLFASRGGSLADVLVDLSGSSLAALITLAVWTPRDYGESRPLLSFWRKPRLIYYWLPPLLCSLALWAIPRGVVSIESTLRPLDWFVSWFALVDWHDLKILNTYLWKTGQTLSYGILYFLWFQAFQRHMGISRGSAFFFSLGLCLFVAITGESRQALTVTREGYIRNVLLDFSGSTLGALWTLAVWTPAPRL